MKRRKRSGDAAGNVIAAMGAALAAVAGFVAFRLFRRGGRDRRTPPGDAGRMTRAGDERIDRARTGRRFISVPQGRVTGPPPEPGFEQRDWPYRRVLLVLAALVAALAVVFLIASLLQAAITGEGPKFGPPPGLEDEPQMTLPPPPVLQSDPLTEIEALRSAEEKMLSSYGWVDPQGQVVRIPITRAMELLVERGLPVAPGPSGEIEGRPMESSSGRMTETETLP